MSHNDQTEVESRWPEAIRLSQLFADPLRGKILAECNAREMSPQSFHRGVGGASLAKVSHAFDLLVHYDWLEKARTDDSDPDAVEHFYRATCTSIVREDVWVQFPGSMKALIVARVFESLVARTKEAMEAGTICARSDAHLTWVPLALDQQGWDTIVARVEALFESLPKLQEDADARMAESGEEPIPMTVALAAFESPS